MSNGTQFSKDPGITRFPVDTRAWSQIVRQMDEALESRYIFKPTEVTIASGAITVSRTHHTVDTEADADPDQLDTINGGIDGQLLILRSQASARDVEVRDVTVGAGNIRLAGAVTMDLDNRRDVLVLLYVGGSVAEWVEITRAYNL
jgi:hypothetical protein